MVFFLVSESNGLQYTLNFKITRLCGITGFSSTTWLLRSSVNMIDQHSKWRLQYSDAPVCRDRKVVVCTFNCTQVFVLQVGIG